MSYVKAPTCDYCGDSAPFGDERNLWISLHLSWPHRLYWTIRHKLNRRKNG